MIDRASRETHSYPTSRLKWSSRRGVKAKERAGWFHNYIGNLSLWSGYQYPEEPRFFDDAVRDLKRAVEKLSAYQPRENLADAYAYKARHSPERTEREDLLQRAERLYDDALGLARLLPEGTRERIELRLVVSVAVERFLLDRPEAVSSAIETLGALDDQDDPPALLSIADRATVYNIASCYALFDRIIGPHAGRTWFLSLPIEWRDLAHPHARALQYLAYALIAWPDVRRFVQIDLDLASLPGRDGALELVPLRSDGPEGSEADEDTRLAWWSQATTITAEIEEVLHGTNSDR